MDILFATGHVPDAKGLQAGQRVGYYICEYLARRHRVHLLALAPGREIAELDKADLEIFASRELVPVTNLLRLFGALSAPWLPLSIAARNSPSFRSKLRRLVKVRRPDAAIFEHTAMLPYAADLPASVVAVGCVQDVFTQAWQRKADRAGNPAARLLLGAELRRVKRWEKATCASLDLMVVLNEKDKKLLEDLESSIKTMVIDPWFSAPVPNPSLSREPGAMIYWGAMDRSENADAARWAANQILPIIRRDVPGAKLYIAGSRGEQLASEFSGRDDVVVTGFVKDVGALMSRMEIALLPLRLGAGIKIKTLECMAAGLPVVTTSVGAEGVGGTDGTHYLISDEAEQLAAHSVALLRNSKASREMGARAKQFIAESRDFAGRMKQFEDVLITAVAERQRVPSTREPVGTI
mgnify:CR=1 FL=1